MSPPFKGADFYLRFNGRTTKRKVDLGSSAERARPRPKSFEPGPCPIGYHEHLMQARLYRCMVCMLLIPTKRHNKDVQVAAGERDGSRSGQHVKDPIESEMAAAGEQTKVHDIDEAS